MLSVAAGRVESVTTAQTLMTIPGVIEATVQVIPGQVLGPRFTSSSQAGYVLIEPSAERPFEAVLHDINNSWHLELVDDATEGAQ
jgi:type III secretory pathway lipoprotein EscJ